MTNLTMLSSLLTNSDSTEGNEPPPKRTRNVIIPATHVREQRLTSTLLRDIGLPNSSDTTSDESDNDILLKRLLKVMTDRDTIDLIYNKLHSV
jgi:hypothetical protein